MVEVVVGGGPRAVCGGLLLETGLVHHLVDVGLHRVLELAELLHALGEGSAHLGESVGPEEQERDDEDDHHLEWSEAHLAPFITGSFAPGSPGG